MAHYLLRDIVGKLSPSEGIPLQNEHKGVSQPWKSARHGYFVEPNLLGESGQPDKPAVILVTAPAAVGKSTVAREVAAQSLSPLWNLSQIRVATGTFQGIITKMYGSRSPEVLTDLKNGAMTFVVDALDEGRLLTGVRNFEAFVDDVATTLSGHDGSVAVIMFGRDDTMKDLAAQLDLLHESISYARYELQYFDRKPAMEFIDKRLTYEGHTAHNKFRKPYEEARDKLFGAVYSVLGADPQKSWNREVRAFLGYAPVLEVMSDTLQEDNYRTLIEELPSDVHAASDEWAFLAYLMDRILEREARKLRKSVGSDIRSQDPDVDIGRIYDIKEQVARLLDAYVQTQHEDPTRPEMTPQARSLYQGRVQVAMREHAFLKDGGPDFVNIVAREYVEAYTLVRLGDRRVKSLRAKMMAQSSSALPSPLLGHLMLSLSQQDVDDEGYPVYSIRAGDVGLLQESLASRGQVDAPLLSLLGDRNDIIALLSWNDADIEMHVRLLDAVRESLLFYRTVSNVDAHCDADFVFGVDERSHMVVGPHVDIVGGKLAIRAQNVSVRAVEGGSVSLDFEGFSHPVVDPQMDLACDPHLESPLQVSWPSASHPWVAYAVSSRRHDVDRFSSPEFRELVFLINMYRKERRRRIETVMKARLHPGNADVRERLVECALQNGVLELGDKGVYVFNTDFNSLKSIPGMESNIRENAYPFLKDVLPRGEFGLLRELSHGA